MFVSADQDYMPTSYKDAEALGLPMYFTGKECKNNHITARYTSSAECFFCRKDKNANPELKKQQKEYSLKNKELINAKSKQRYHANIEFEKLRTQSKWINNKEVMKQRTRDWEKANPEKKKAIIKSRNAIRKHKIKQQKPSWADMSKIREIYLNCPKGYHVDHIIPLKGKTVSGLHVETNLQYLEASENMRKHNKFGENYGIFA